MTNGSRFWIAGIAVLTVAFLSAPVMAVGFSDAYAWWRLADQSDSNPGVGGDQALSTAPSPQSASIPGAGSNNMFHSGGAMQTQFSFTGGSTIFIRFRYNGSSPISEAAGVLMSKSTPGDGNTLRLRADSDVDEARVFGAGLPAGFESDPVAPGSHWPAAYTNDSSFPVPGTWYDMVYRDDIGSSRYGIIASESAGPFVNVLDSIEWHNFALPQGLFEITNPFSFGEGAYDVESAAVFQGVLTNEEIADLLPEPASLALVGLGGLVMLKRRR